VHQLYRNTVESQTIAIGHARYMRGLIESREEPASDPPVFGESVGQNKF
jgi:hypothetical protein